MGWEELIETLEELETEREYDGYFYSIQNAAIILVLGSFCDLKSTKRIHKRASTEHIKEYLKKDKALTLSVDGKEIRCTEKMDIYEESFTLRLKVRTENQKPL